MRYKNRQFKHTQTTIRERKKSKERVYESKIIQSTTNPTEQKWISKIEPETQKKNTHWDMTKIKTFPKIIKYRFYCKQKSEKKHISPRGRHQRQELQSLCTRILYQL